MTGPNTTHTPEELAESGREIFKQKIAQEIASASLETRKSRAIPLVSELVTRRLEQAAQEQGLAPEELSELFECMPRLSEVKCNKHELYLHGAENIKDDLQAIVFREILRAVILVKSMGLSLARGDHDVGSYNHMVMYGHLIGEDPRLEEVGNGALMLKAPGNKAQEGQEAAASGDPELFADMVAVSSVERSGERDVKMDTQAVRYLFGETIPMYQGQIPYRPDHRDEDVRLIQERLALVEEGFEIMTYDSMKGAVASAKFREQKALGERAAAVKAKEEAEAANQELKDAARAAKQQEALTKQSLGDAVETAEERVKELEGLMGELLEISKDKPGLFGRDKRLARIQEILEGLSTEEES
jgi:hypothetical protein